MPHSFTLTHSLTLIFPMNRIAYYELADSFQLQTIIIHRQFSYIYQRQSDGVSGSFPLCSYFVASQPFIICYIE